MLTVVGGKIVHATDELTSHAPPSIPVLPESSPVKVFGGYGAPLDIRKAARAGVSVEQQLFMNVAIFVAFIFASLSKMNFQY